MSWCGSVFVKKNCRTSGLLTLTLNTGGVFRPPGGGSVSDVAEASLPGAAITRKSIRACSARTTDVAPTNKTGIMTRWIAIEGQNVIVGSQIDAGWCLPVIHRSDPARRNVRG